MKLFFDYSLVCDVLTYKPIFADIIIITQKSEVM